jgi:RNA-binding protein YlmH
LNIYSHFHPDERAFVDKAWDWVERAAEQHAVKLVDFLDPRQAFIVQSLINRRDDVALHLFGGYEAAERKRGIIGPDYREFGDEDVPVAVVEVSSPDAKFADLDHGDFLGAMLGLGIKRDKLGDIHVFPDKCHCVVAGEIADFININLRQVHRVHVLTDVIPLERLETKDIRLEEMDFTVASLRLDAIAGDVYRLSRAKILAPIQAGRCKVNWKPEEDPSKLLKSGDVVSVKGLGRFQVLSAEGVTKSGRTRVKIGKYV